MAGIAGSLKSFVAKHATWTLLRNLAIFAFVSGLVVFIALWVWVASVTKDVPDYRTLAQYEPSVTTRVHAGDGKLIAEFASEHRIFVPYESMPEHLIDAFVSAEDKSFFEHGGLDYAGIVRAAIRNVMNKMRGQGGLQGASTITQQVAKNMLLTSDQRLERKVKEAVIARRMERAFSKEQILEIYLNEIYLGGSSYGVASAALNYFNKSLPELSLEEAALLAAMPKAPGDVNPYRKPEAAFARRNWVINRMVINGYISQEEADEAIAKPITIRSRLKGEEYAAAAYFVEELRRDLVEEFGEEQLYKGGLSIRSTLDTRLQLAAQNALRKGLEDYDRRQGFRGPIAQLEMGDDVLTALADVQRPAGYGDWESGLVSSISGNKVELLLVDSNIVTLASEDAEWAKTTYKAENGNSGLQVGNVVLLDVTREPIPEEEELGLEIAAPTEDEEAEEEAAPVIIVEEDAATRPVGEARIGQIPEVEGALLALNPHNGRILAMAGGYSFWKSQFNRATQASRQPGSSFKPFVYAAAMGVIDPDTGQPYTPVSKVLDAPFVQCDYTRVDEDPCYRPTNYSEGRFYGMSTLRLGLEKSRNAMTVRLAQEIGMEPIVDFARQIGLYENLPPYLSMSLGAGEVTVWDMSQAYAVFVNGGKEVVPTLFDRVQDRHGKTLYRHDKRACEGCKEEFNGAAPPVLADTRQQLMDPVTAYQTVHMLEGVVERGTATIAKRVGKPLAGKTGTSNDYVDAWFMGFSPDLVVGVFVGFDEPKSMGDGEAGGRVAAPIFTDFMEEALKDESSVPFRVPAGVRLVNVDATTGELPGYGTAQTILEAFKPGTEPGYGDDGSNEFSIFGSGSVNDGSEVVHSNTTTDGNESDQEQQLTQSQIDQQNALGEQDEVEDDGIPDIY